MSQVPTIDVNTFDPPIPVTRADIERLTGASEELARRHESLAARHEELVKSYADLFERLGTIEARLTVLAAGGITTAPREPDGPPVDVRPVL